MTLGQGYFKREKLNPRRCAVCRFYLPTSSTRGTCRVAAPLAQTDSDRALWTPTEPHSSCGAFSRLRPPHSPTKGEPDLPGQTFLFQNGP